MSRIRSPAVAGYFYPAHAGSLARSLEQYYANVEPEILDGEVIGLICPHAGYTYSGQTAAYAYRQVYGGSFDVVVVISPAHRMPVGRFAVSSADAYDTPLGTLWIDGERLSALQRHVRIDRVAHDGQEHSIEVQLPFLQVALGDFRLLPVMIGDTSLSAGRELGIALADVLADQKALIVASTDLYHIPDYEAVLRQDQVVVDAIASLNMDRIKQAFSARDCSVCGRVPVYAMLTASQALGANRVRILHHTTSGDVTGLRAPGEYTVGYLAAAVYRASGA